MNAITAVPFTAMTEKELSRIESWKNYFIRKNNLEKLKEEPFFKSRLEALRREQEIFDSCFALSSCFVGDRHAD